MVLSIPYLAAVADFSNSESIKCSDKRKSFIKQNILSKHELSLIDHELFINFLRTRIARIERIRSRIEMLN